MNEIDEQMRKHAMSQPTGEGTGLEPCAYTLPASIRRVIDVLGGPEKDDSLAVAEALLHLHSSDTPGARPVIQVLQDAALSMHERRRRALAMFMPTQEENS
jgi:hypothetical protein